MKKQNWLFLFFIVLAADLLLIYLRKDSLRFISKPLLLLVLLGYFYFSVKELSSKYSKWIFLALSFSWLGDVLLLFEPSNDKFFMFGLIAFLLAHFFYISFFSAVQRDENIKAKPLLGIIAVIWYVILMKFIKPAELGGLAIPVRIYGAVIMIMFWMALQMIYSRQKPAGFLVIAGAFLFAASDSILAINKFFKPVEYAGVIIMLTYGLAQFLLTEGCIRYIQKTTGSK